MINRIILALAFIGSATIASEPVHPIDMDDNISEHVNSEIVVHNTRLLTNAIQRADKMRRQIIAADQIEKKFLQQNGTSAAFSYITANYEAGQEIVDRVLNKNLSDQSKHSKRQKLKRWISRKAKL